DILGQRLGAVRQPGRFRMGVHMAVFPPRVMAGPVMVAVAVAGPPQPPQVGGSLSTHPVFFFTHIASENKLEIQEIKLAVVGLGYVGLPLAVEFGKKRSVLGF